MDESTKPESVNNGASGASESSEYPVSTSGSTTAVLELPSPVLIRH